LNNPLPEPTPLVAPQSHLSKISTHSSSDLAGKNEVLNNNTPGSHPYSLKQPQSSSNICSCSHHVMAKGKVEHSRISPVGTQYYHVPPCPSSICSDSDLAARNAELEGDSAGSSPYFPMRPKPGIAYYILLLAPGRQEHNSRERFSRQPPFHSHTAKPFDTKYML
jgi:hypothetical protein